MFTLIAHHAINTANLQILTGGTRLKLQRSGFNFQLAMVQLSS